MENGYLVGQPSADQVLHHRTTGGITPGSTGGRPEQSSLFSTVLVAASDGTGSTGHQHADSP